MSHLYVHIPFCASRCGYCDFTTSTDLSNIDDYVTLLCHEVALLGRRYPLPLKTLYFGGGTPSLLPVAAFQKIVAAIEDSFGSIAEEFTVEVNPESVTAPLIETLARLGVNRISLGMQARQAELLALLDRNSRYRQVEQAVALLRRYGVVNYNIDLIYGIPGQTLEDVAQTIDSICQLGASHVSAYALKLENDAPLARRIARGDFNLPDDDTYADMLDLIIDKLAALGINRYEVSNFSRNGYHSRHNSAYWSGVDTLGVGLAAVYKVAGQRFYNTVEMETYRRCLAQFRLPYDQTKTEKLSLADQAYEYAILNLRTNKGISLADYHAKFAVDFCQQYAAWIDKYQHYGVLLSAKGRLYLNRRGLNTANYILSDL